jgi:hypothetical protein
MTLQYNLVILKEIMNISNAYSVYKLSIEKLFLYIGLIIYQMVTNTRTSANYVSGGAGPVA